MMKRIMGGRAGAGGLGALVAGLVVAAAGLEAQTEAETAMAPMASYVGVWESDERVAPDDRSFRFVYDLHWYGESGTIVELLITQRFDDGEELMLWKGFKGWAPAEKVVYYYGFSPGGRVGRGIVEQRGEDLVTEYEGWGPAGPAVEVRDVFGPIDGDSFRARTEVRRDPRGDWAVVSEDVWTRIRPRGPTR